MNNNLNKMYKVNDELYTPRILVEPIIQFIPKGKTVWCPFDTENSEFVLVLKKATLMDCFSILLNVIVISIKNDTYW